MDGAARDYHQRAYNPYGVGFHTKTSPQLERALTPALMGGSTWLLQARPVLTQVACLPACNETTYQELCIARNRYSARVLALTLEWTPQLPIAIVGDVYLGQSVQSA